MPYYLTQYIEGPTRGDKKIWIPAGSDQTTERNWIRLERRGKCLLWTAVPITHLLAKTIGEIDNRPSTVQRTVLSNFCGDRTFGGMTLRQIVIDILKTPPAGRWTGLFPSRLRQRYEIWLGPGGRGKNLLFSEKKFVAPSTNSIADTFDRVNGNLNGSTSSDTKFQWVESQSTEWVVDTNTAYCINGVTEAFSVARADLSLDTVDQYVQAEISAWSRQTGKTLGAEIYLRGRLLDGSVGDEGYGFVIGTEGTPISWRDIYDFYNSDVFDSDTTATTSGTIYLEMDGSTLTAKLNGDIILGPVVDGTPYNTYKKTGIGCYIWNDTGNNYLRLDNFTAGDLAAGGVSIPVAKHVRSLSPNFHVY